MTENNASETTATPAKRAARAPKANGTAPSDPKPATPAPAETATATPESKPATVAEPKAPAAPSYRRYLTADAPDAMVIFRTWIMREFPELGDVDQRLVTIASKCYKFAQSSDLNR